MFLGVQTKKKKTKTKKNKNAKNKNMKHTTTHNNAPAILTF